MIYSSSAATPSSTRRPTSSGSIPSGPADWLLASDGGVLVSGSPRTARDVRHSRERTPPGHRTLTPIPHSARSALRTSESPTMANLEAEYGASAGTPMRPPIDEVL